MWKKLRQFLKDNRVFIALLLCMGLFRTAVADWNPVPTGSMRPTILEGDVIFINRLAYDLKLPLTHLTVARLGEPQRGDVVTFNSPADHVRLVKRVIGLPGDVIAMRSKRLIINGEPVAYEAGAQMPEPYGQGQVVMAHRATEDLGGVVHSVQWLERVNARDDFDPVILPADQYLMLGDNRDNSADSRYFGLVPRELLIGRADRILVSAAIKDNWLPRVDRFWKKL